MILKNTKIVGDRMLQRITHFKSKGSRHFHFPSLVQATILLKFLSARVHCHIQRILPHSGSQLLQFTTSCAEFSDSCLHWLCWILQLRLRTLQSVVLCTTLTQVGNPHKASPLQELQAINRNRGRVNLIQGSTF